MNSLESGRRPLKLRIIFHLLELTIFVVCVIGIGYFIYLIATIVRSYQ